MLSMTSISVGSIGRLCDVWIMFAYVFQPLDVYGRIRANRLERLVANVAMRYKIKRGRGVRVPSNRVGSLEMWGLTPSCNLTHWNWLKVLEEYYAEAVGFGVNDLSFQRSVLCDIVEYSDRERDNCNHRKHSEFSSVKKNEDLYDTSSVGANCSSSSYCGWNKL
jgi:hypothetical protein